MFEETVRVAEFAGEEEAQVALARLRYDGIAAEVVLPLRLPWHARALSVVIVAARSQADRARFILDAAGIEVLEPDWERLAEEEIDGWMCAACDTEVSDGDDACPVCREARWGVGA